MTPSKYVPPELDRRSLSLILLLLLGTAAFVLNYCLDSLHSTTPTLKGERYRFFLVGLVYGWTAAGSWILSLIDRRYLRWAFQLALAVVFASVLSLILREKWLRFISSLGGMVLSQSVIFHFLKIPVWQKQGSATQNFPTQKEKAARQFGAGELLAFTTFTALLLASVIRYQPREVDPATYWLTLLLFWCIGPLSAASMIAAILRRQGRRRKIGWAFLSVSMTLLSAMGLAGAQYIFSSSPGTAGATVNLWHMLPISLAYGTLLLTILAVFATMASLGRCRRG